MQPLPEFLIHASAAIAIFYIFFRLTLRTNTHFKANRIFLISALIITLAIALWPVRYKVSIPFTETVPTVQQAVQTMPEIDNITTVDLPAEMTTSQNKTPIWMIVYMAGILFFGLKLITQIAKPLKIRLTNKSEKTDGFRLINTKAYDEPFSLFNCIFLDTTKYNKGDLDAIIAHEKVHIQERHWIDLLIVETFTVIFWFNPFIWLFERAIKENHEFLADAGVISRGHTLVRYQALLVNQLMGMQVIALSNNLNFALGPNRLNMMKKEKSPKRKLFRIALLIPVIVTLLYAFSEPEYVMETQPATTTSSVKSNQRPKDELANFFEKILKAEKNVKGKVLDNKSKTPLANVKVSVEGLDITSLTDNNGEFSLKLPKGFNRKKQDYVLELKGYKNAKHSSAEMSSEDTTTIEVTHYMTKIIPAEKFTISGKVVDENNNPKPEVKLILFRSNTNILHTTMSNSNGEFTLQTVAEDNYGTISTVADGYLSADKKIDLAITNPKPITIKLEKRQETATNSTQATKRNFQSVNGMVIDSATNRALASVTIKTDWSDEVVKSNQHGEFTLQIPQDVDFKKEHFHLDLAGYECKNFRTVTNAPADSPQDKEYTRIVFFMTKSNLSDMAPPPPPPPALNNNQTVITGKVVDIDGNILIGANVIERDGKGRFSTGTITTFDGTFKITPKLSGEYTELMFSFIGYKTEVIKVKRNESEPVTMVLRRNAILINTTTLKNSKQQAPPPPPPPPAKKEKEKAQPTKSHKSTIEEHVFIIVEAMPQYKGGYYELNKFIIKTAEAKKENFFFEGLNPKGKEAVVGFTIDASGKATNIKVIEDNDASKALVKIIEEMPAWKPGEQRGKKVPVDYVMKYTFE